MAVEILGLPVVSCMALSKLLNFSVPQVPDSYSERGSIYIMKLFGELSKAQMMMMMKKKNNNNR